MKNILLITLLVFFSPSLIMSQSADDLKFVRFNAIHVNEVEIFGEADPGIGVTVEVAFVVGEADGVFQTVGFEIGHITSDLNDLDDLGIDTDIDIIPILVNYTIGGDIGESGFIWEAGIGLGGILMEFDSTVREFDSSVDDDDFVIGGQIFGSLGYEFTESFRFLVGLRYMTSSEAEALLIDGEFDDQGEVQSVRLTTEDEVLSSMAIDFSLNWAF